MSSSGRRGRTAKKSKVRPGDDNDGLINEGYEMNEPPNNRNTMTRVKKVINTKIISKSRNPINLITNLKQNAKRWRDYATSRRKHKQAGASDPSDRRRTGGQGLIPELGSNHHLDDVDGTPLTSAQRKMRSIHNRNLIEYFARLGQSKNEDECVSLEYVESLLLNGANVNCTDKYGQTVLHEAVRAWDVDVARFLIEECRANINQPDERGRTPLHVAAAVDYPEMVSYLIEAGANKEARTIGEEQTPVHFAARNDACSSLKVLIKLGCLYKEVRDYKGRTPLHVAAELDRSETARMLLEIDDPAPAGVIDNSGQGAIVWMITKMPPVAKIALDQFHTTDRANRKQFYHLQWLEPRKPDDDRQVYPQTAMQVIIDHHQYDLVTHAVITRLISLKWKNFGKLRTFLALFMNLAFILLWTIQGILVEYNDRHRYDLPNQWWRILIIVAAVGLTGWQIKDELGEFFYSKKQYSQWRDWRKKELERDLKHTHPRWPEEAQYLKQEMEELDKIGPQYFNDFWNIFDWICYTLLIVCMLTHIIDVAQHTDFIARLHIRIMSVTVIVIWLRLMKNVRAFSNLGPFIVIVGQMMGDVVKFIFLYCEFYIPYACAFYMIFGGEKVPQQYQGLPGANNYTVTVTGLSDFGALLFSLFRLTLVDEYDYDGMKSVDAIMTDLLLASWFALSAILMLNLFIALMSDTFQRVYDNAKANAVMQKAIAIQSIEEGLSVKRRRAFREFIHTKCAPEKDFYDDDTTEAGGEDLKKHTMQIKEELELIHEKWDLQFNPNRKPERDVKENLDDLTEKLDGFISEQKKKEAILEDMDEDSDENDYYGGAKSTPAVVRHLGQEMDQLRNDVNDVMARQKHMADKLKRDMGQVKTILQQIAMATIGGVGPGSLTETSSSRRPVARSVNSIDIASARSTVMEFSDPLNTLSSMALVPRHTMPPVVEPRGGDDEWALLDRRRQHDLKELREKLNQQQQLASVQNLQTRARVDVVTTEDDDDASVREGSRRPEGGETDSTMVPDGHTTDTQVRASRKSRSEKC